MTEQAAFLPFHAINEFMRADFRISVIRTALGAINSLPDDLAASLNRLTRKHVTVPGFRNSERAPAVIKALPMAKAFEKSPELVAAVLAAWAEAHADLRQQVYDLLKLRGWKMFPDEENLKLDSLSPDLFKQWAIFPLAADRRKAPGFYPHWPKGEEYETLYQQFNEIHPDAEASIDQLSLMVVWLSLRLPYHVDETLDGRLTPAEDAAGAAED
ncbi:MAG: hypothetical protein JW726_05970 [Anaerolineales bacterium]|nr:hypothetical protein [Anaerolineales bacterium]